MPLITVTRLDSPKSPIQLVAGENHDILLTMERAGCTQGDIYRDGAYLMSAWQSDMGVWSLYCRAEAKPTFSRAEMYVGGECCESVR